MESVEASTPSGETEAEAPGASMTLGASALPPTPDTEPIARKIPRFGARKVAQRLQDELGQANASLEKLGALDYAQVQEAIREQRGVLDALTAQCHEAQEQLDEARREIVATEDVQILQEVGVYEYRHPLTDAAAYQGALKALQDQIKAMIRVDGGAVSGATNWTVNGSVTEGRRMVRETSKLMLRAYNAEADNLVRGLKPYKLDTSTARLTKVAETAPSWGER